jgi:L-threonylcarbamoyladenylate synthase
MASVAETVAAIRAGKLAVLPTDTVYGLAADPDAEAAVRELSRAKGRDERQPIALVAADLDSLFARVPELDDRATAIVRALLPGAYTLVLPNPGRRYPWLAGARRDTIGVRVLGSAGPGREVLEQVGAVAATSANLTGEPDPCTLAGVPEAIRAVAAALLDGGELPGTPSTVLDLTGPEPRVLREGAVPAAEALRLVASVL